jgi:hypothetical protein
MLSCVAKSAISQEQLLLDKISPEVCIFLISGFRRLQKFSHQNMVILVSLLAVLMVSLAILMIVLLLRHNPVTTEDDAVSKADREEQDKNTPIASPIGNK